MARERLAVPQFISKKEYDRYIRRRLEKNDLCLLSKTRLKRSGPYSSEKHRSSWESEIAGTLIANEGPALCLLREGGEGWRIALEHGNRRD